MKLLLTGVIALVAICRFALGGEGVTLSAADPLGAIFRLLVDFGALGAFIIFLIWDRKREHERRDSDNKRWHTMDQALFALVEKCTLAIAESTSAMCEIRQSMQDVCKEMRRINTILATGKNHSRRESDTDTYTKQ